MALYERLLGYTAAGGNLPEGTKKIPPHGFCGMMAERARGLVTNPQIVAAFTLDAGEIAELSTLADRFTTGPTGSRLTREVFVDVVHAGENRLAPYNTIAAVTARLGV